MKNILMNKKGFTLLEILVTVGIVGVLSAVAVPAYNQYKRGTIETAVESDIGNFQKAYMAYNAVNGTYCATFSAAGITVRDGRNYSKKGAIGFNSVTTDCGGTTAIPLANVQYTYTPAACGSLSPSDCNATAGCTPVAASTGNPASCTGTPTLTPGTITGCELDVDQFKMGATTNVSGIEKIWGINEEGKIGEHSDASVVGAANCADAEVIKAWQ